MATALSMDLR
jgi:transposase